MTLTPVMPAEIEKSDSACQEFLPVTTRDPAAEEPAVVKRFVIGNGTRKRLSKDIRTALEAVNHNDIDVVERQYLLREMARKIAKDNFGDSFLKQIRQHLKKGGIIVWENLPTPPDCETDAAHLSFGEVMAAVLAQGTTESYGYVQEDAGRLYQRLFAMPGVTNGGKTPDALLPHLDNAFLVRWAQPEVIHLYCVNNDAKVGTNFYTMPAIARGIREGYAEREIGLLQRSAFVTSISNSFIKNASDKAVKTCARPVLYRKHGYGAPTHFLAKAYDVSVQPGFEDDEALQHALAAYQDVLKTRHDLAIQITAHAGQAVSFHQQQLLHGRGPITLDKYREMVRAYGRFNLNGVLSHLGYVPANYVFDAMALVDR